MGNPELDQVCMLGACNTAGTSEARVRVASQDGALNMMCRLVGERDDWTVDVLDSPISFPCN